MLPRLADMIFWFAFMFFAYATARLVQLPFDYTRQSWRFWLLVIVSGTAIFLMLVALLMIWIRVMGINQLGFQVQKGFGF